MKGTAAAGLGSLVPLGILALIVFSAGAVPNRDNAAAEWVRERERMPSAAVAGRPSSESFTDPAWTAYVIGTEQSRKRYPSCHVRPQILAAIAEIESHQGTYGASSIDPATGNVDPPIIGIALDGTNGTAAIADTDGGWLDGDTEWDRAVGPFQFIPSSWARFGADGNGDGAANPHNMADAALAAALHLCSTHPVDFDRHPEALRAALFAYNNAGWYVNKVLDQLNHNDQVTPGYAVGDDAPAVGDYALPLPRNTVNPARLSRPHHNYPAIDIGIAAGTPLYAITAGRVTRTAADEGRCGGTIVIDGHDGFQYTYCHLSQLAFSGPRDIAPGEFIGLSGGIPGAPGAGNTTGPHLHLSMRARGISHCPQTLLISIYQGQPIHPESTATQGCTYIPV